MIKKIFISLLLLLCMSCFDFNNREGKYLDYIESGIISLYNGDKDYIKYFDKAYSQNPSDDLLYKVVNNLLEYDELVKFYSTKKDKCLGYDYYINKDFVKAKDSGNMLAIKALYEQYYYNFEFKKAYNILTKCNVKSGEYIYKVLDKNKDEFFEVEEIYNKMKDKKASDEEKEKFKNFVITYPVDYEIVYDVLKDDIEKNDKTALFIKYLTLDKDSVVSNQILNKLVSVNFGPAIEEYVSVNKIDNPSVELLDKMNKYSKRAYAILLSNCVESGNISNINYILSNVDDNPKNCIYIADFDYYYKDLKTAYNEYLKAYNYGFDIDYVVYRLSDIAKKIGKEKEFLKLTKNYTGENEYIVLKMRYDLSKDKLEKKRIALNMWITNPKLAASCLLELSKNDKNIACYTNILKMYK